MPNEIRTSGVLFQLYFMIFSTVSSFCCFIVILACSAQSGFVDTRAAIVLYFELVILIFGCQDVIRRVPHGSCRYTPTVIAHYLINVVYTRLSAMVNLNVKSCFLRRRDHLSGNKERGMISINYVLCQADIAS